MRSYIHYKSVKNNKPDTKHLLVNLLKRISIELVALSFMLCTPAYLPAQQSGKASSIGKPSVLVPPFENLSVAKCNIAYEVATNPDPNQPKRTFFVDRYTEAPRGVLEDIIGSIAGLKVVERQRVDSILLEAEFGRLSGLVDTEKAVKLGRMLGANTIVLGTILDIRTEKRAFSGYGIKTDNILVKGSIRVRVIDITKGTVPYSKIARGSVTYASSSFGGVTSSDVAYEVIEAILEELREDDAFKLSIQAGTPAKGISLTDSKTTDGIEIEFTPKPDNADIELDGKYVGGSPIKLTLAGDKEIKVKIKKAGHKPWESVFDPKVVRKIAPELEVEAKK